MFARHHNNKANKVSSASFADQRTRCVPSIRTHPSSRHYRTIPTFNRRLRGTQLKLAKISRVALPKPDAAAPSAMAPRHRLAMPAFLPRPAIREIQPDAISASSEELKDVEPSYLREKLAMLAPNMLAGLESARIIAPTSHLPSELEVVFSDAISIPTIAPTHILALTSSVPSGNSVTPTKFTLYPIHQLVFAANCSSLPSLPLSPTATPAGNTSQTAHLPVVRLAIPSPATFPLLQTYLYVKDTAALRSTFLPANWANDIPTILQRARSVQGFWANACAFGVVDASMFEVIEACWAEILRALQQATPSSTTTSDSVPSSSS